RAAARHGRHRTQRPVQPRPPDLGAGEHGRARQTVPARTLMAESVLPPAICLMGPTASGKTALALDLCRHLPCEIISVDSALVYRGMDVGTAKPTAAERAQVPHHLIDIRDP